MNTVIIYIAAITIANLLVAWLGPWVSPLNSLFFIGLDLSLRDRLHERWKNNHFWLRMLGLIAAASLLSYLINPATGKIALASMIAFGAAALLDTITYRLLINKQWFVKANGSNVVGAAADSLIFPTIAFGGFLPHIVALQFAAKVLGGLVFAAILKPKEQE